MLCVNPLGLTRSSLKHNPFPGPPKALPEGRRQICRHPDRDVSSFRVEFVTNALPPRNAWEHAVTHDVKKWFATATASLHCFRRALSHWVLKDLKVMNKFPFTDRFNRCLQVFAGSVTWFDKDKTFPSSFGFISELVCSGMPPTNGWRTKLSPTASSLHAEPNLSYPTDIFLLFQWLVSRPRLKSW